MLSITNIWQKYNWIDKKKADQPERIQVKSVCKKMS